MGAKTKIWGHRGCRGQRSASKAANPPENSIASFKAAIQQGADGIECDVFLTKDHKLVVFHDDTLERMTNGVGDISSYTLAELRTLRLRDNKGALTDLQIPTLDEVFDLATAAQKSNPAFTFNIEIKVRGIAAYVGNTIEQRFAQGWKKENLLVSSYDMASLREMRKLKIDVPLGMMFDGDAAPWNISETALEKALADNKDIHPELVGISLPSMTPNAVRMIHAIGAKPYIWPFEEVNPETLMQEKDGGRATAMRIHRSGLVTVITDYPEEMRALMSKFQEHAKSGKAAQK